MFVIGEDGQALDTIIEIAFLDYNFLHTNNIYIQVLTMS